LGLTSPNVKSSYFPPIMGQRGMTHHLVDSEQRALNLRNSGNIEEAAELFAAIVKEQPDWEHGIGFYNLACCYEDLGKLQMAEECYNAALQYQPANSIFLGGLASFLYLHGEPKKAFNSYLELLEVDRMNKDEKGVELSTTALKALGEKMGLSHAEVTNRIEKSLF
jgi:tetratricopeptide (TPR) repeat protein